MFQTSFCGEYSPMDAAIDNSRIQTYDYHQLVAFKISRECSSITSAYFSYFRHDDGDEFITFLLVKNRPKLWES